MSVVNRQGGSWSVVRVALSLGIVGLCIWYEYVQNERMERMAGLRGGIIGQPDDGT